MRPVTQTQVAGEAGVDKSTVSLALRNDPRIPGPTAERVRAAAARLGYRPDPAFAWIAGLRWRGGAGCRRITLAFVAQSRQPRAGEIEAYLAGARARADELGYGLEPFWMDRHPNAAFLQRVLIARGIYGLIVGPFFEPEPRLELDWGRFCIVNCAQGHFEPAFHTVTHDPHEQVLTAWRRALEYGYRRPGLVLLRHGQPLTADDDDARWAAALLCRARGAPGGRVPALFFSTGVAYATQVARLVAWYRRWRPDAVIGFNGQVLEILEREARAQVPGQLGFAAISRERSAAAGIKRAGEDVGRAAVDLLQLTLQNNQWGLPAIRILHRFAPEWVDGYTLPRRSGATG